MSYFDKKQLHKYVDDGYIRVANHPTLPLSIYNYTDKTTFERRWDLYTRACRGLVLDGYGKIVIKCIPKFFNSTEPEAATLNGYIKAYEKLDGYYIAIRDDSEYGLIITSRGSFDNQYVDAAYKIIKNSGWKLDKDINYFCELEQDFPGDEGIIVMRHPTPKLTCWAITSNEDGEYDLDEYETDIPKARRITDVKEYMCQEVEGIVVKNQWGDRVKMKTNWYLNMHAIISNCTKNRVFDILRGGGCIKDNEFVRYVDMAGELHEFQTSTIPEELLAMMLDWEAEMRESREYALGVSLHYFDLYSKLSDKDFALSPEVPPFFKSMVFALRKKKPTDKLLWGYVKRHCLLG